MVNEKIKQLTELKKKLRGGEKAIQKQHDSGKYTARERLEMLLDLGSFVEIGLFVKKRSSNFGLGDKEAPGDGVVTGYGTINGRLVYVAAQDFTVLGGSLGEMHADKIVAVQEKAMKAGAPMICINDSGGARIQEGVNSLNGYGKIFYNNTMASGIIPQLSVILGPCAGGAVYSPALMDFIFMVRQIGQMYITGPNVIKAVIGEDVTAEDLGGAMTHNEKSGVAHFLADSEKECFEQIKTLLSYLPQNNMDASPIVDRGDDPNRRDGFLDEIIPDNPARAYDMKSIIFRLADNGEFFETQQYFAQNIITGFIRMDGKSMGVIASQPMIRAGCLDIDASDKASRFIRTCDAFNIPLLTLEDVPGFLPGTDQEFGGIIRHGAKMLYAYSEATVPKITIIVRKAYGGAYIGMCSKPLGADFVFAWPSAEVAVMGAEGAVNIIFRKDVENATDKNAERQKKIQEYNDKMMNPYVAAEIGYVDDVILPRDTRAHIISTLQALENKRVDKPQKKHGNIPL